MQNMYQPIAKSKGNSTTTNVGAPPERLVLKLMQRYSLSRWMAITVAEHVWISKRSAN